MAALVLSVAGSALGGSLFGGLGAIAGKLVGAVAGNMIDHALFGGGKVQDGPRLKSLDVQASTEGAPIPRIYGRVRLAGQVIWATPFEETASMHRGGKALGGGQRTRTYDYFANVAIGLCEGPVARIGRIWADGRLIDQSRIAMRFYGGSETQSVDPLIAARQGAAGAPAYRGLAYVVFERLPLADYGNRLPQFSFEIIRPVGALERNLRSVVLIPGSSEHGYDMRVLQRSDGGTTLPENRHTFLAGSDAAVALDELQALCPSLTHVSLVVAWMGDDLRLDRCTIRPSVESRTKQVAGTSWQVAGEVRETARLVTTYSGRPALGGTPSDDSVISLIQALKARGLAVTLYPFVMMDIATGNGLPDPYGAAEQAPYPWRGQMTCHPAPGRAGSPDGTSAIATQMAQFFGNAQPAHFSVNAGTVSYSGPAGWGLRRMVLHMAALAAAAGGVDGFIIGSEMPGVTRLRSAAGVYPAAAHLATLAADVKTLLPAAQLTYAADWTEYGSHVMGQDVRFPLDPLWSSPHIAAIGIDLYAPLTDWRDGASHADIAMGSPYDTAYLRSRVRSGEAFDWYYANAAERAAQTRRAITDSVGKPWIYRQKDILNWWSNAHVERVAGQETTATAWVPRSKPVWLTEIGFPAVDKGANQPSVFPDPKSSVAGIPYFSSGQRDDLAARRALEATLAAWDPALGATPAENPLSPSYAGRMIDPRRTSVWAYDLRPFPAFPQATSVWSDGDNWRQGHWLNGRLGALAVGDLAGAILADYGISDVDAGAVTGSLDGFIIDRPMNARAALEPLATVFRFSGVEQGARLVLSTLEAPTLAPLTADDCARDGNHPLISITRRQESELPISVSIGYLRTEAEFRPSSVQSRRLVGASRREESIELTASADPAMMAARAEDMLHARWAAREEAHLVVPPSRLAVGIGDTLTVIVEGETRLMRVTEASGDLMRKLTLATVPPIGRPQIARTADAPPLALPPAIATPSLIMLDLPAVGSSRDPVLQYAAVSADPWPGEVALLRQTGTSFAFEQAVTRPATIGTTLTALPSLQPWCWNRRATLDVKLDQGTLEALPEADVLAGANCLALSTAQGWLLIQFAQATLIADKTYRLATLLVGQGGSEHCALAPVAAGSRVIRVDDGLVAAERRASAVAQPQLWRAVPVGESAGGPHARECATTPSGEALRLLAPVQPRARMQADGLRISWLRRARQDADGWDIEPPLDDALERYRLRISTSDGTLLREMTLNEPQWLYSTALRTADGAGSRPLSIEIAQLSSICGPGHTLGLTLSGSTLGNARFVA